MILETCRFRKILKNAALIVKIGVDTAENEPSKEPSIQPRTSHSIFQWQGDRARVRVGVCTQHECRVLVAVCTRKPLDNTGCSRGKFSPKCFLCCALCSTRTLRNSNRSSLQQSLPNSLESWAFFFSGGSQPRRPFFRNSEQYDVSHASYGATLM